MKTNILFGVALAVINLSALIVAYGIYYYFRPAPQILFQSVAASALSIIAFFATCALIRKAKHAGPLFQQRNEFLTLLVSAFLFIPIIFVPVHYFTQGYLTSFGNIAGIWLFQLPTNVISIFLVR